MGMTDVVSQVDARGLLCPIPTIGLDLIDGVEFAEAPAFLDFAGESDVQLFI